MDCVPHSWGSVFGVDSSLHFLAEIQDQPPSFKCNPPLFEFEQCENPFRDLLSVDPIIQINGKVKVPTGPGLGIEINRNILDQFRVA